MPTDLFTTTEAARWCGLKSDSSIRHAIRRGDLPAEKLGKIWIIRKSDLEVWKENTALHIAGVKSTK